jgi:hypothetical protein
LPSRAGRSTAAAGLAANKVSPARQHFLFYAQ